MMPIQKACEGKKLLYKFVVYKLSGTVLSENTRSETEVSGKVYGPNSLTPGGEIKSQTTRYQNIYLKEDDGAEHALELKDLVVACREGHKLTLWRLEDDLWFKGDNETTNQTYTYDKLKKLVYPKVLFFVFGILFGLYVPDKNLTGGEYFFTVLFTTLVGLAIATIPCGIVAWMREKAIFDATGAPNAV